MSAPPGYRPTPADLARQQFAPRPASDAPAPPPTVAAVRRAPAEGANGLREGELMRSMYLRGMRISRLLPESRLIALTLMGYADYRTGVLSRFAPDTEQLSYATGLNPRQARLHVEILTQRGWLGSHRLTQGPRTGQVVLHLGVPPWVLKQLRDHPAGTAT